MDFVWTLLDFSMEPTKVCVKLVWRLCFGVEFVWILNFGFIPTFRVILGLIVGWFYAVFLACLVSCLWHVNFVALIGRILWSVEKGYFGMVSGQKLACTRATKELSGTPMRGKRGWVQNCSPRVHNCVGFQAIA